MNYQDKVKAIDEMMKVITTYNSEIDKLRPIVQNIYEFKAYEAVGHIIDLVVNLTAQVTDIDVGELGWYVYECNKNNGSLHSRCISGKGVEVVVKDAETFLTSCDILPE